MLLLCLAVPVSAQKANDKKTVAIPATGAKDDRLASFDRMMTAFMKSWKVPGAAIAVTKDRRLVYARGFGYADRDSQEPVQPDSLFRLASISKPITAVAVLHLVEKGKLSLDDKVMDVLKYKPHLKAGKKFDPRWNQITILHLLQHRGGWDRDKSFDPMFDSVDIAKELKVPPPAQPEHIIRYMMGLPLDFTPGERFAYSNFGYCILGRLIEKTSGKSYEEYVHDEILKPLGIRDMRLGKTLFADRAAREVKYYDKQGLTPCVFESMLNQRVPWPYGGWCLEAMDAHGGWVASAPALVRFAAAFDDPLHCRVLNHKSIRTMFARPPGQAGLTAHGKPSDDFFGCGWAVVLVDNDKFNTWHGGSLDGTSTILVRRHDGVNWAILFNSRDGPLGVEPSMTIDLLAHTAADRVKEWPEFDLFEKYH